MRQVGVLGGTFDPVHVGHLVAASEVAHRLSLDEVVFVPAGDPWQKPRPDLSPAEDRYAMAVIATQDEPRFRVSRVDLEREGPTYTVDTLTDLRAEYDAAGVEVELWFVTGADALAGIPTWHRAAELSSLAHVVGVTRPGTDLVVPDVLADVTLVEIPALDVSSSQLRARVHEGAPIRYLVPDGVAAYVHEHGLYRVAS